ncbi:DUF4332 domain-containing protein [Planctomicrobium sp. SH664]|uniref:DUF4332 domain-containing protein n=1 Tax=Planctomicrobium sp. SH664 TaxID=3448125 RepID=UPI003F5BF61D
MQLQNINIDGFGTLSQFQLGDLGTGLNVIHGTNGSGKTTLVQFLRGVLLGYDDARKQRLLPPLKGGRPGGQLTMRHGTGRFEVIRHARPGHSDTLAINLLQGSVDDVKALRKSLQKLDGEVVSQLFQVSGYEAQNLARMTSLALKHDIDLTPQKKAATWVSGRIREVEQHRAELLRGTPSQGRIAELEDRRLRLQDEIHSARQRQSEGFANWQRKAQELRAALQQLQSELDWTLQELQGVETDLSEVQNRLWSRREQVLQEVETVQRPATLAAPAAWKLEIEQLDREIANAQQVLRDLAAARMRLSLSSAQLTGVDVPDLATSFQQQRVALTDMESQTDRLLEVLSALSEPLAHGSCQCRELSSRVAASTSALREQIWAICQELSRQQAAQEQSALLNQRSDVDRCELELTRQIQRLRQRRESILRQNSESTLIRQQFRTKIESSHCECHGHEHAIAESDTPQIVPQAPQVIVRERVVSSPCARPNDPAREVELLSKRDSLRNAAAHATQKIRIVTAELLLAEQTSDPMEEDRSLQQLKHEFAVVEQQLADAREQWQSLAMLQAVLQRTQQKLQEEVPSVVMQEASGWLNRMTEGRYPEFRFQSENSELLIANNAGAALPAAALSRGTLEQAALSFRLALCSEFQRRGLILPLVLDDVLADSDEQRLRAAAEVLVDYGRQHQILFLTCQDHLASLFAALGIELRELPGSVRPVRLSTIEFVEKSSTPVQAESVEEAFALDRVQPDEPYWLQVSSPVGYIPSLGAQFARRLGALGVRTIEDMIDLDPEVAEIPLHSLQISAMTLRQWQAEARLLCCVPDLTGRDAQLLVICGLYSPAELGECDLDDLHSRVTRLRGQQQTELSLPWLADDPNWPSKELVGRWIQRGRHARSLVRAREWAKSRRSAQRTSAALPKPRDVQVRLHQESEAAPVEGELRYFLTLSSPIVDAPSIGSRTAERLQQAGVFQVSQLLQRDPRELAAALNRRDVTTDVVTAWQRQAELMCSIPELRGHDAQVLVSCGVTTAERVATMSAVQLFALIEPFVTSKEGQRLLRSARTPDQEEVAGWISCARAGQITRAA